MLRRTKVFVILFFLISVGVWKGYDIYAGLQADNSQPVINMESESLTVSVKDGDSALLEGVTAEDAGDGDLTDKIFIESRRNFIEKGKFSVTFAVADSDNHVARATREIVYSDYVSPQFELTEPLEFAATRSAQEDVDIAANLSAHDVIDGNISNRIRISGDYTMSSHTAGDYPMEFIVMNSLGDTVSLPVTVKIYGTSYNQLPKIKLKKYLLNVQVGTNVDLDSMVESIEYRGVTYRREEDGVFYSGEYDKYGEAITIPAGRVSYSGEVDPGEPGVYEITYTYNDSEEEITNNTRLYLVVYD
ncbi:MAG: hypothetical protein IKF09_02645 [Clostridiales bacterium]|nr:hypothetical protein [Clostridiales bacterium]